jgi:hypothetical protein
MSFREIGTGGKEVEGTLGTFASFMAVLTVSVMVFWSDRVSTSGQALAGHPAMLTQSIMALVTMGSYFMVLLETFSKTAMFGLLAWLGISLFSTMTYLNRR